MKLRDAILVAYRGLTRHWVRATLNVLGIVAGVASVIMLVSVAHAVSGTTKAAVEGLGANLVVVYPSGASSSGVQLGLGTPSSLTSSDVTALSNIANVPDAVQAVPTAGSAPTSARRRIHGRRMSSARPKDSEWLVDTH